MVVGALAAGVLFAALAAAQSPAHPDAKSACDAMNTSMMIEVMHGFGKIGDYSRNSGCGYECGRKTFRWDNGPQGFGDGSPAGKSTQWPSSLNMGATFDPELAGEWGLAMGTEFWTKGTNIQEGPGVNIARIENNGRTFEYLSGEDPILGGTLVKPLVNGIQQHVMSITKHYIMNNQETDRSGVNEIVDEKTLMELYSPAFGAAASNVDVHGQPSTQGTSGYMCAYNRINGDWACEQPLTLKNVLKTWYNFSGFVVSDWGACHSTAPSINAGLDIEMPHDVHFTEANIVAALDAKNITKDQLHESCVRIMSGWYNLPEDKRYPCGGGSCMDANASIPEHKALAYKIAAQSTVLLKNENNLLPLDKGKQLKVALIGGDASEPYVSGQGSGGVPTSNELVSPVAAFQARGIVATFEPAKTVSDAVAAAKAADVAIVFGSAHSHEGADRKDLLFEHSGSVLSFDADSAAQESCSASEPTIIGSGFFDQTRTKGAGACCTACLANKGCVAWTFDGPSDSTTEASCFLKDNTKKEHSGSAGPHTSATIPGRHSSPHHSPSHGGGAAIEDVIKAVGAVNKKTIVVAAVPGQILTDWREDVAAILCAFLPGEQFGNAIADLIYGDAVPQAKLPVTFPKIANEQKMTPEQYPGVKAGEYSYQANYSEGQINGYRWYDKHPEVKPAYPFGHGLSYGNMSYSGLKVDGRTVSFSVAGTGCDTPQVYLSYPSAAVDPTVPSKVLRYFKKVCATGNSQEMATMSFTMTDRDVSAWDVSEKQWKVTSGKFSVSVGSSSQDVRLTGSLIVA